MESFARIPRLSEDYEDAEFWKQVDAAAGPRQRSTRQANLGTFTGYRIGFDIGNGNIGWCILFEDGKRSYFLRAEDIVDHNRRLPKSGRRTQLPDLASFVPMGTHKFQARERQERGDKSFSKIRAEARAARRLLDARQRRRLHVRKALQDAGLLPKEGESIEGQAEVKADILRVNLLSPSFSVHPHDLGRALYNALKRRGYLTPVGRDGTDEGSGFASQTENAYRQALSQYGCLTIGEFLERCADDARRDNVPFRKRHQSLAWQKDNRRKKPRDGDNAPSYEAFQFLTPTFSLVREECEKLRKASGIQVDDNSWAHIEEAAEFRRPLQVKTPGPCRYFPDEYRCVAALPSFQWFRSLEQAANLRDRRGAPLNKAMFDSVLEILAAKETVSLNELSGELGVELKLDRGDRSGAEARRLVGAKTDATLGEALGETWRRLPIEQRDDWTMRFLRRHWPPVKGGVFPPWNKSDTDALEREAEAAFGDGALAKVDAAKRLEDRFSSISVKAARLIGDCYRQGLDYSERLRKLREHGSPEPEHRLYERLPYYGEVMPDETVPAAGFAPEERTVAEEWRYGRAANPDVHVVMNRLRVVVNAIIEMMGGILPTRCIIEMARSTFSETQAAAYNRTNLARKKLRKHIEDEIKSILGSKMPTGPALDRLVDRWKAASRQGWRDYDGSDIQRSALVDGSEYQLDHVEPAAFGDFRENNIFVSRFNRQKGRRLPWEAFGNDSDFQPALVAFATFGLRSQIEASEKAIRKLPESSPRRERTKTTLKQAQQRLKRLTEFSKPRLDVLQALERTDPTTFRPSDQAALFRRFHPDRTPRQGGPAARDIANIGWSTKIARRYLCHLGARTEPIKAWAVHALRCMFDINKDRSDLRNHAVDAFLVAHFDRHVLKAAFARLHHEYAYEELYRPSALQAALSQIDSGDMLFKDFQDNLLRLEHTLPTIHTAHRADNRWNPGDMMGTSLGPLGKDNIYSFRPKQETRKELTELLREAGLASNDSSVLNAREILARYEEVPYDTQQGKKLKEQLTSKIKVHYRGLQKPLGLQTVRPLSGQKGAFINVESKFAVVGSPTTGERQVLSVADFSRMDAEERANVFAQRRPIFRQGDTVMKDGEAFVVTGANIERRLIVYPVNEAERGQTKRKRFTPDENVTKLTSDVLGRRLHRRGKATGDLQPVPYPLRDK